MIPSHTKPKKLHARPVFLKKNHPTFMEKRTVILSGYQLHIKTEKKRVRPSQTTKKGTATPIHTPRKTTRKSQTTDNNVHKKMERSSMEVYPLYICNSLVISTLPFF